MFHCLAYSNANSLIGGAGSDRSLASWQKTYRALDHGQAKSACKDLKALSVFDADVLGFADVFVTLQEQRHLADYDPLYRTTKSEAVAYIERADSAIEAFDALAVAQRRAFAAHVLFKKR